MGRLRLLRLLAVLSLSILLPQGIQAQTSDFKITPEMLGLPDGNARTAEPYETRVYPTDDKGNPIRSGLDKYDKSYPIIVDKQTGKQYKLDEKEGAVFHGALDLSSRPATGKAPVPLDFKAGVYGTVLGARGTDGVILVQLPNGNIIHYLHTSEATVEPGQKVKPNTVLGKTGNVGTGAVHLHLQATDPKGKLIDVDKAFLAGRKPDLWTAVDWKAKHWVDFKPDYQTLPKPKVEGGVVKAATRIGFDDDSPKHWVTGTSWSGSLSWSKGDNNWRSYSGGALLITFKPDGKCYILEGDDNAKSVKRFERTWQVKGNDVIVSQVKFQKEVVFPMPAKGDRTFNVSSKEWSSGGNSQRFEMYKGMGLRLQPPTVDYRGYRWMLGTDKDSTYMRADP
jgi:hypothetical protein